MWGTILSFLGSKVFSKAGVVIIPLLAIMAFIIVPNAGPILEKFGVVTRASLQAEVTRLSGEVTTYKNAVEKLTKENKILTDKSGFTIDAIEQVCRIDQLVDQGVDDLLKEREEALAKLNEELKATKTTELRTAPKVEQVVVQSTVKTTSSAKKTPTRQQVDALSSYNYDSIAAAHSSFFKE